MKSVTEMEWSEIKEILSEAFMTVCLWFDYRNHYGDQFCELSSLFIWNHWHKSESLWNHVIKNPNLGEVSSRVYWHFYDSQRSRNTCSISMFIVDKRGILSSFMMYQHRDFRAKLKMEIWWKSWVYEKKSVTNLLKYVLEITVRITRVCLFTLRAKKSSTKSTAIISYRMAILSPTISPELT